MTRDNKGNMMINRYMVLANLGQGAYGKVKLGQDTDTGKQVAIKIISKKHLKKKVGSTTGEADNALNREIAIMKKVRHKNCVSLYEVIDDPVSQRLYLIMDYIPNGPVVRLQHQRLLPLFLNNVEEERRIDGILYNRYVARCVIHHDASAGSKALST
uniref:non-specific serine/threonine protein kinase n=1 Tax=Lygus hesperus TaxID=30085 RepID=A0A0A9XNL7_LYGHE